MHERSRRRASKEEPEFTAETLMAPGVIEDLTRSGRVPSVRFVSRDKRGRQIAHVRVPPKGTQFGDSIVGPDLISIPPEFAAPDGRVRGRAAEYQLPLYQGSQIQDRVLKTAKEIGLIKPRVLPVRVFDGVRAAAEVMMHRIRGSLPN